MKVAKLRALARFATHINVTGYGTANLSVVENSSTKDSLEITVSGSSDGQQYDVDVFGDLTDIGDAVELDLALPVETGKTYTITQTNPALKTFYPTEFANGVKTKSYTAAELAEGYGLLLMEGGTPVTVVMTENGKTVMTITINNQVTFA